MSPVLTTCATLLAALAGEDAIMLLACLALAAGTVIFIFFIEADPADSAARRSRLDQLLERRDTIYDNLRDLKFEYRAGKYSEQDFESMKQSMEGEAAVVLAQIEELTGGAARPGRRAGAPATTVGRASEKVGS
jgi:hypothetical protein